ncbi:hypothetical protein QRD43_11755 [Pelomonas sp. APW6]|uniref:Uncharacterized protein n=1 Tax=Roseateles subflavus TaxID=3053353 RepID=A0ABT7LI83_9BURK|nr:hypothetical protein [Pelomonas sp. APW6]MDL5032578.1 hypothetical protein [Pelomonas sp. APW6]
MNITVRRFSPLLAAWLALAAAGAEAQSAPDRDCVLKGLVAYGTAREAIVRNVSMQHWRVQADTSEYQYSFLDELYRRKAEGQRDFHLFGAEKLLACMSAGAAASPALPPPEKLVGCFAEMDVVLHARQYKAGGGGLAGTRRFARNYVKDPVRYPQEMLDRILPRAFALDDPERLADYREQLMGRCLDARLR